MNIIFNPQVQFTNLQVRIEVIDNGFIVSGAQKPKKFFDKPEAAAAAAEDRVSMEEKRFKETVEKYQESMDTSVSNFKKEITKFLKEQGSSKKSKKS